MKKVLLSSMLCLSSFSCLFGQNENAALSPKKLVLKEFSFIFGESPFYRNKASVSLAELKMFAPNSVILPESFAGFESKEINVYRRQFATTLLAGFDIPDKGKSSLFKHKTLRVGLFFNSQNFLGAAYSNTNRFAVDTLLISGTNDKIPIDSVINTQYNLIYSSFQLGFDASLIIKSPPEKWVSFYGGFGLSAAKSVYSFVVTGYSYEGKLRFQSPQGPDFIRDSSSISKRIGISEELEASSSTSFAIYAPLGINIKLTNQGVFLSKLHLFYELRAGLSTTIISNYGFSSGARVSNAVGLRYNLN